MEKNKLLTRVKTEALKDFASQILVRNGLSEKDAKISADVLVEADIKGIESHGVARLSRYINHIKDSTIDPESESGIIKETPVSLLIDGRGSMGQPTAYRAMQLCIEKARNNFICIASIRNSNHYGIAGFYTDMALKEKMIGISMTNSAPLVVPTNSSESVLGTNPLSLGVPSSGTNPFLLDMATSTVPRGKLEVYSRKDADIPDSWATDSSGQPTTDPSLVLNNLINRSGGGLLPLGGEGELTGGHKGYGLAMMVEILSSVLSGGKSAGDVYKEKHKPSGVCHFLGAINPEAFTGTKKIMDKMASVQDTLRNSNLKSGSERIYAAGDKSFIKKKKNSKTLLILTKVFNTLNEIGAPHNMNLKEIDEQTQH